MPAALAPLPAATSAGPSRRDLQPPGVLAVVLGHGDLTTTLPAALQAAVEESRDLFVAVLRPRPPWTTDAALARLLAQQCWSEVADLVAGVDSLAVRAGVQPSVSVHLLAGLRGRRRDEVLERTVTRLARRLDAQPFGVRAR